MTNEQYSPFFDQESPVSPIKGLIAEHDQSEPYELDACGVFRLASGGYLVVEVSGCSCWPDRGGTTQTICPKKEDVDRILHAWPGVKQKLQDCNWQVSTQKRDS